MPTILGANTLSSGFEVANSLRFNEGDSASLNKTGTSGDRRTWTWSCWLKRCTLGSGNSHLVFGASSDDFSTDYFDISITGQDVINIQDYQGSEALRYKTTRVFRDISAWYHIVVRVDTTQSTASNRVRVYINGVEETSFSTETDPSQNTQLLVNKNVVHRIGGRTGDYSDLYLAECVLVDGSSLAPTSFGEFDEDSPNVWKPIDVSGLTFGNNGFYLDFEDSSNLGNDKNGGTDFTVNNLAATDQSTDTCTNNFPTLNSLVKAPSSITFSEGNLKAVHPGSWTGVPATIGVQNGKWYWECKVTTGNSANAFTGICIEDVNFNDSTVYNETGLILYFVDGRKTVDGTDTESFFTSLATNDIVGVALDLDSGTKTVTFTKNGSASGSAVNLTSNFDNKFIFPVGIGNSSSATSNWEFNFGSPHYSISSGNSDANGHGNFEYAVPSGHFSINTKNLAEHG
tara:strand:- start:221 stop:1594 length:1374 start_codon:yes stop_codon:yes gene_type:complete